MNMPKTMKAAILVAQNEDLLLDKVTLPEALDYGQVLVEVFYSGICGSQIGEIKSFFELEYKCISLKSCSEFSWTLISEKPKLKIQSPI